MNFSTFSKKAKIKELLILLPLDRENLTSFLSPILGQFGIKNPDFINAFISEFNKISNNVFAEDFKESLQEPNSSLLDLDLIVPVSVIVFRGGKFELFIKPPTVGFLFTVDYAKFRKRRRRYTNLLYVYKVAVMKSVSNSVSEILSNYKIIRDSFFVKRKR